MAATMTWNRFSLNFMNIFMFSGVNLHRNDMLCFMQHRIVMRTGWHGNMANCMHVSISSCFLILVILSFQSGTTTTRLLSFSEVSRVVNRTTQSGYAGWQHPASGSRVCLPIQVQAINWNRVTSYITCKEGIIGCMRTFKFHLRSKLDPTSQTGLWWTIWDYQNIWTKLTWIYAFLWKKTEIKSSEKIDFYSVKIHN